jgi:hypothetical protein
VRNQLGVPAVNVNGTTTNHTSNEGDTPDHDTIQATTGSNILPEVVTRQRSDVSKTTVAPFADDASKTTTAGGLLDSRWREDAPSSTAISAIETAEGRGAIGVKRTSGATLDSYLAGDATTLPPVPKPAFSPSASSIGGGNNGGNDVVVIRGKLIRSNTDNLKFVDNAEVQTGNLPMAPFSFKLKWRSTFGEGTT